MKTKKDILTNKKRGGQSKIYRTKKLCRNKMRAQQIEI